MKDNPSIFILSKYLDNKIMTKTKFEIVIVWYELYYHRAENRHAR